GTPLAVASPVPVQSAVLRPPRALFAHFPLLRSGFHLYRESLLILSILLCHNRDMAAPRTQKGEKRMKKIFLFIPEDVHRAAKMEAVAAGMPLKDYVAQAVAEKAERDKKARRGK